MSVILPLSVIYAVPAFPVFLCGWLSQIKADRSVRELTNVETPIVADQALSKYLKSVELEDVEVVRSDNYMQNEYIEAENKIYLSPDTTDHTDVASVALALRAGAQAKSYREAPEKTKLAKSLHTAENVAFWTTFSVLAFGVMATNMTTTIVGYALGVVVWLLWRQRLSLLRGVDRLALDFAKGLPKFDAETLSNVEKVLAAERRKF